MKIAKCKMQIYGKNLIHFSIFDLIFAICNDLWPILQTAELLRKFQFLLTLTRVLVFHPAAEEGQKRLDIFFMDMLIKVSLNEYSFSITGDGG
jgi:hypothetical protein